MEAFLTTYPKIQPLGERSILIEFEPQISEKCLEKLIFIKNLLEEKYLKENVEVINTYTSLLVFYIRGIENIYDEVIAVKSAITQANLIKKINCSIFNIPVCYSQEFGIDLGVISEEKSLSFQEIISIHTSPIYTVYFMGFLPGFLYLGGLDERLHVSRRKSPRLSVPKGSVGIGETQTGIYPKTCPGGWQIIGNSPLVFFDKKESQPCKILAGDKVKFQAISKDEYEQLSAEVKTGEFVLIGEKYGG